jgi:hypothetical protein
MARILTVVALMAVPLFIAATLQAATVNDLVGTWLIDGPATWDKLKASSQVGPQLSALPPDQQALARTAMIDSCANQTIEFTTEKVISINNGARREESFKVTKTDGDELTTESIDDQGKHGMSTVQVSSSQLVVTNLEHPDVIVVLKRQWIT